MNADHLNKAQLELIQAPIKEKIFLEGLFGCGKTTTAIERLSFLLQNNISANEILIIIPYWQLLTPYLSALSRPNIFAFGKVTISSLPNLARKMIKLFQPFLIKEKILNNSKPLIFLNYETAQYYMSLIVKPLLEKGYFTSVIMDRNRLYAQILDTLNKAAEMGFPHTEIGERLISAWTGEKSQINIYEDLQECAIRFRDFCIEQNFMDISRQLEVFYHVLCPQPFFQHYFLNKFRHLIMDNIEEDIPLTHDLAADWIQQMDSAFIVYDQKSGYRQFLGADPIGAYRLEKYCQIKLFFDTPFSTPEPLQLFSNQLSRILQNQSQNLTEIQKKDLKKQIEPCFQCISAQFFPEMLHNVITEVQHLIHNEHTPPTEIVVLAPYLSESLLYSIQKRCEQANIPTLSIRPSNALYQEDIIQCLITMAALVNLDLGFIPSRKEVAHALYYSIEDLDIARAFLLTQHICKFLKNKIELIPADKAMHRIHNRINLAILDRYERLRNWLLENQLQDEDYLDIFINRLFQEVLSQPGYKFHSNFNAAAMTTKLINSFQNFRYSTQSYRAEASISLAKEYCSVLRDGILAAQYQHEEHDVVNADAVLISPAYTYLISNRTVDYQFWLDIGSLGWSERPLQPLTHPYVLHRNWAKGKQWTEKEEHHYMINQLDKVIQGLIYRCKRKIYVSYCELSVSGRVTRGPLLHIIDRFLRNSFLYGT